ncbi:hypothetical protein B0H11DRAFT_1941459 [Mycena galericulata]|nr:hypothetical protein B0H11DRAFT_1941459 [Mycena galericulata]
MSLRGISSIQNNLRTGGCLVSIHDSIEAATWIENNWANPIVKSSGCNGPLALFSRRNPPWPLALAKLSGFPVVVRPSGEIPARTPGGANQLAGTAANDEGQGYGDPMEVEMSESAGDGSGESGRRSGDNGDPGSERDEEFEPGEDQDRYSNHGGGCQDGHGDGDGDDGGGPTQTDDKWDC